MGIFKKTTKLTGKFDNIVIHEGQFMDNETGEVVDIATILEKVYGDKVIKISTAAQDDEDIDI